MSVMATPAQPERTLAPAADKAQRTWATKEEVYEAFLRNAKRRSVRPHSRRFESLWAVYNALRKRATYGEVTISKDQLARDLYPDVALDPCLAHKKRSSVRRWLRVLEEEGLIQTSELRSGAGKSLGLHVELLAVPEVVMDLSSARSSAG
jgi:hypothetical protein